MAHSRRRPERVPGQEDGVTHMQPKQTNLFLAQLSGRHTFQTFDERPEKDKRLSRILHDSSELHTLNQQGAGVFVMVNEGNSEGREKGNVIRIRAYCADFDGQPLPEHWPLEPSMQIESSPNKFHAYWILEENENAPLDNAAFNAQQEAIARAVGSCLNDCKGLNRVMRVPGFLHQKGEAFTSRLLSSTDERFTFAQIQAAFPILTKPPRPPVQRPTPVGLTDNPTTQPETQRKYALTTLRNLAAELTQTGEGERNNRLNEVGFRAGRLIGGGHLERGEVERELLDASTLAGLPDSEARATLHNALTAGIAEPETLEQVGQHTAKGKTQDAQVAAEDESGKKQTSGATRVMDYAQQDGAEFWHNQSGNAFMTTTAASHREHYRLPSQAAKDYLHTLYYAREKRGLGGQALKEAARAFTTNHPTWKSVRSVNSGNGAAAVRWPS